MQSLIKILSILINLIFPAVAEETPWDGEVAKYLRIKVGLDPHGVFISFG